MREVRMRIGMKEVRVGDGMEGMGKERVETRIGGMGGRGEDEGREG